jgi:magnesium transporter
MDIFYISDNQVSLVTQESSSTPANGFLWIDATHDEVAADPEAWRNSIVQATSVYIYDLHLKDVTNLQHPSHFDSTQDYEMVIFRKLALGAENDPGKQVIAAPPQEERQRRKMPPVLGKLATVPVSFLLMDRALVTVNERHSKTIDAARSRLLAHKAKPDGNGHGSRPATSPAELMLRLLNDMVDQYLELRQPLTTQLDRWQRALLSPTRPFKDWSSLLDARNELHKLDHLCEEQHDALQELRDHFIDTYTNDGNSREMDLLLVRINDVMEHITRVLNHARRLESSLESAVQIHFASVAHRTSEIMRTLTVITALFMPLTLITGIFGMNFVEMPLLKGREGFWITMGAMFLIVVVLLFFFRRKRYLDN